MFIVRVGFITRIMNFYLAELKNTEVFLEILGWLFIFHILRKIQTISYIISFSSVLQKPCESL